MYTIILPLAAEWTKVATVIICMIVGVVTLALIYTKITDKTRIGAENKGCGWPLFLILVAVIIGILINLKNCSCENNNRDYDYDSIEYQHIRGN